MGLANKGRELMVFDWDRAAELILRSDALDARAGLSGDWEWTGGEILRGGRPVPSDDTYTFLASTWATPEIEIMGDVQPCYRMQSTVPEEWLMGITPGDEANIYWPESALRILRGQVIEVAQ